MFKKALITTLFALFSTGALAETQQSESLLTDEQKFVAVCAAATESPKAMKEKTKELKVSRRDLKKIVCNDLPLKQFARLHKDTNISIATVE